MNTELDLFSMAEIQASAAPATTEPSAVAAVAHPEPVRSVIDEIMTELQEAMEEITVAAQQRALTVQILRQSWSERPGAGNDLVRAASSEMLSPIPSRLELDRICIGLMVQGPILRQLGIAENVEVAGGDFREMFLSPVEAAHREADALRRSPYWSRLNARRRCGGQLSQEEMAYLSPPAIPQCDLRAALVWLQTTYAGEAGERVRKAALALRLVDSMSLKTQSFEPRGAWLTLEYRCYPDRYDLSNGRYHMSATDTINSILKALSELMAEIGEPVPEAMAFRFGWADFGPESSRTLTPHLKLRCFKEKFKLDISTALAESLRTFVAEAS